MLTPRISRYISTLIFSLLGLLNHGNVRGQQAADTTVVADTVKPKVKLPDHSGRHLAIAVDLAHPILNQFVTGHTSYEFSADYYLLHDLYLVADGGWGSSNIDYSDLKYQTKNSFFKGGINRSLLLRNDSADWNNMFIGFRLAAANIHRSAASYIITDSLWGNSSGTQPGKDFVAAWAELGMGVRVQIVKDLCVGWFMSGRFMLNSKSFKDLAPAYIAGFGRGDKNSSFDFDFYMTYGFRWKRKNQRILTPPVANDTTGAKNEAKPVSTSK